MRNSDLAREPERQGDGGAVLAVHDCEAGERPSVQCGDPRRGPDAVRAEWARARRVSRRGAAGPVGEDEGREANEPASRVLRHPSQEARGEEQ